MAQADSSNSVARTNSIDTTTLSLTPNDVAFGRYEDGQATIAFDARAVLAHR